MDILTDIPMHVWIAEAIRLAALVAGLGLLGVVWRWNDRRLIQVLVVRALRKTLVARGLLH